MVATATMWATGTPATTTTGLGTWANPANAAGANDAAFAVFTSGTVSGEVATILCTGYGLDCDCLGMEIPASVDSIVATVYFYVGTTARWTAAGMTVQLMDGATPLGSTSALTRTTTTSNSQAVTFTGVAAWANLANFGVRITGTLTGTTSSTLNVDAVGVVMNYTPSPITIPPYVYMVG